VALTGKVVDYDTGWHDFFASGRTFYHSGRDSWDSWAVGGDRYCSMWPPSDLWAWYEMEWWGDALRFVGDTGDVTPGVLRD
jgi:hypothetical protein